MEPSQNRSKTFVKKVNDKGQQAKASETMFKDKLRILESRILHRRSRKLRYDRSMNVRRQVFGIRRPHSLISSWITL
jgi:hypothetical protein